MQWRKFVPLIRLLGVIYPLDNLIRVLKVQWFILWYPNSISPLFLSQYIISGIKLERVLLSEISSNQIFSQVIHIGGKLWQDLVCILEVFSFLQGVLLDHNPDFSGISQGFLRVLLQCEKPVVVCPLAVHHNVYWIHKLHGLLPCVCGSLWQVIKFGFWDWIHNGRLIDCSFTGRVWMSGWRVIILIIRVLGVYWHLTHTFLIVRLTVICVCHHIMGGYSIPLLSFMCHSDCGAGVTLVWLLEKLCEHSIELGHFLQNLISWCLWGFIPRVIKYGTLIFYFVTHQYGILSHGLYLGSLTSRFILYFAIETFGGTDEDIWWYMKAIDIFEFQFVDLAIYVL